MPKLHQMLYGAIVAEIDHARNRAFMWKGDGAIIEFHCGPPCEEIARHDLARFSIPRSLDQNALKQQVRETILSLIPDPGWAARRQAEIMRVRASQSCDLTETETTRTTGPLAAV